MAQEGYVQCGCCGRLYKSDGSEDKMYDYDHSPEGEAEAEREALENS